jgi:hypothetical protein
MACMSHEARVQLESFKEVRVKHPRLEEVDDVISEDSDLLPPLFEFANGIF